MNEGTRSSVARGPDQGGVGLRVEVGCGVSVRILGYGFRV